MSSNADSSSSPLPAPARPDPAFDAPAPLPPEPAALGEPDGSSVFAFPDSAGYLQIALQSASMGTWNWDLHARSVTVSREARAIYGVPDAPTIITREMFAQVIHPNDRARLLHILDDVLAGQRQYQAEFRIVWPDGSVHWIEHRGRIHPDGTGTPNHMIGICADITERRHAELEVNRLSSELERHVAERTRQLQDANQELEAFTYSVSHDLRAPLRGIDGFSLALLEDWGDRMDDEARESLAIIRAETRRMAQLIDALLDLSRVSRTALHRQLLDMSRLAQTTFDEWARREPERRVTFAVEPNLTAFADANLIRIVLDNLIGNAWKFTSRRPDAVITFGAELRGGEPVWFVRDNGAGFDPARVRYLFGAFQRLHSASEFPGMGIGLATVQRIIHRHGGRAWAEGAVGAGATFRFTLPEEALD